MIWNATTSPATPLARHICEEIAGVLDAPSDQVPAMADAVAQYILHHHGDAALRSDYLVLLITRALWSLGQEPLAREFIAIKGPAGKLSPEFVDLLTSTTGSVPCWQYFLQSKAVRPGAFASVSGGTVWILNVRRLADDLADRLELSLYRTLNAVIDQIGNVWDATTGHGVLGLYGTASTATSLLGCTRRSPRGIALAGDIRRQCAEKLRAVTAARKWTATPELVMLDL